MTANQYPTTERGLDIAHYLCALPRKTSFLAPDPSFPLHAFPPPVAAWLNAISTTTRVPLALTAFPFLAGAGAVIGYQLQFAVGPGWHERPALWVALITLTGVGKTPAISAARQPFDQLHEEAWTAWRDDLDDWRADPDPEFDRPRLDRLITNGATIHALTDALQDSTGLLILRDELYGLIRAMDRRGGEDRQHYLSLWSSEPLVPTRLEDAAWITAPVVGIVGGLQPTLLQKVRRKDQDGFLERFLMIFSAGLSPEWSDVPVEGTAIDDVVALLRPLRSISGAAESPHGLTVTGSPEARAAWADWFASNEEQQVVASLSVAGFYHKLPSHLARLALILHALWHPDDLESPLSGETMRHAIDLVEYVRVHIHRSITLVGELQPLRTPDASVAERIIRILGQTGEPEGWVGRSSLQIALGRPETGRFDTLIDALVKNGFIHTRSVASGGRPATQYRIAT